MVEEVKVVAFVGAEGVRGDRAVLNLAERQVFTTEDALLALSDLGVGSAMIEPMLSEHPALRRLDDTTWVRWSGGIADQTEVVLRLRLEPLSIDEIKQHLSDDRTRGTLRNALAQDDRFVRVDRAHFALTEWNIAEYEGLAEEIHKMVVAEGGSTTVDYLIARLGHFGSEASIRSYAASPRFVTEGNRVRIRGPDEPYPVRSDVRRSRGVFFEEGADHLSIVLNVDSDMMRGSGRFLAASVCGILGLAPGDKRSWTSDDGSIHVGWNPNTAQPQLSSVRSVATSLRATEGDLLVLRLALEGDRAIASRVVSAATATATALEDAFGLDKGQLLSYLASCMGCRATTAELVTALKSRKDSVVATIVDRRSDLDSFA